MHEATAISHLTWVVTIRGTTYRVAGDRGAALVIEGPAGRDTPTSVEGGPFSATFPGKVFGAAGEVVVTPA
jgi:hypothetical protein